jgi:hypothetical protein
MVAAGSALPLVVFRTAELTAAFGWAGRPAG